MTYIKNISIVLIAVIISSMIISNNSRSENLKINEPNWGKSYTQISQSAVNRTCYCFPVYQGDNISIKITSFTGQNVAIYFGEASAGGCLIGGGSNLLIDSSTNMTTAIKGYIDIYSIASNLDFWLISGSVQNMMIYIWTAPAPVSSIQYSIDKKNSTSSQNPEIQELHNQIEDLITNLINAQSQIEYLTQQLNILNSTITSMNNTQKEMLANITNLWKSYDRLNQTLKDLTETVNNLNSSSSQNLSQNIKRIEQNITKIKTDIYDILNRIEDLSKDKEKLKDVQDQLNNTLDNITAINQNITQIKNTMPDEYNDTVLKTRITQLENENKALKTEIDNLKKNQQQKVIERRPDNGLIIGAFAIGIIGILIGLFALMSKRPKASMKDNDDENPKSKDYEKVEERPKAIPKAKAKKIKNDDDDLDEVSRVKD